MALVVCRETSFPLSKEGGDPEKETTQEFRQTHLPNNKAVQGNPTRINKNLYALDLEVRIQFTYICIYNCCMYMNVEERIKTEQPLPLQRRTIIHLMLINNLIGEQMSQALKPFEVSLQQFNVLRILRGQKGKPANLSTLNDRMVSRMSNTTRLVDKLIAKGLAIRNTCPENRRKVEIRLTDKGLASLQAMDKAVDAAEKKLMGSLSEKDLRQLNDLLDKV